MGRVVGLDVARALALVGMMATHILPDLDATGVTLTQQVAGGRSSALFAVLAGVSLSLMSGRAARQRGRVLGATAAGLAVRALLVAVVGLALGMLDTSIAVILTYYGLMFLLALPFLGLRFRTLVPLAAGWLLVVPAASHLLRPALPRATYDSPAFGALADPAGLLAELSFTGYYPAVPWMFYLLVGMAVGRLDLTRGRTAGWLAGVGAVLAGAAWLVSDRLLALPGVERALEDTATGVGIRDTLSLTLERGLYGTTPTGTWWWLAVRAPHTATPFDLAHTAGTALLVIGACLAAGLVLPRVLALAFGAGAMTLTMYSVHVTLRTRGLWDDDSAGTFAGQVALVLLAGAVLRAAGQRGPLEATVGLAQAAATRAAAPRRR